MSAIPEGFVWSDEVEAFVFSVSDGRSSDFDHGDPDAVTKTLHTQVTDEHSETRLTPISITETDTVTDIN